MNQWNLPPGMTGAEYEVAGPESEEEQVVWCPECGQDRPGLVRSYGPDSRFTCDVCQRGSDIDLLSTGERIR